MNKFNVGDEVMMADKEAHLICPNFYPKAGTVGVVAAICKDDTLLIDWGQDSGVELSCNNEYTWYCNKSRLKKIISFTPSKEYTDDEVWEMLKPKMKQFSLPYSNIDNLSQEIKNMIVAAYRSGYGRATKGRDFMIKPKVKKAIEKARVEDSIDTVLGGKMIVTFYEDDDSYNVANFKYACENGSDTEIYADIVYGSAGDSWAFGYDTISDPDCEMYVAIPFKDARERFKEETIKAMYCGKKSRALNRIKQWAIGEYKGIQKYGDNYCAILTFEHEKGSQECWSVITNPEFKALVPLHDYLKYKGVNV